ncbi:tetratricopeptide repeat protein [Bradyrhizobium barranii subsp. barranii]|uniref:Tetratricopeptide repeat protein n=1 Tax=Bradyrhizobium barranii subsp. barranii TaxID=2823807 RepID=A0A7Z0QDT8_9BRAD|nr:tetratricopeptide repeat protein [Bradyrhizobium barranii]UGX92324.1 tetratricopeptide repeat protein [Bradyrhizobium barranii subsp. barranii]
MEKIAIRLPSRPVALPASGSSAKCVVQGGEMSAKSNQGLRIGCRAALIISIVVSAASALAATPQDLNDCQDNSDVPRMMAACGSLSQDARLPPGARSMALLKHGFGNFALGNMDAAQADFTEAVRLNPKNNYAHHELGLTLAKKGDTTRAIASLTEAINLDPSGAASRFIRGQIYMSEDRLDEAIRDFTDAIRLGPDKNTTFAKDQEVSRPEADRVATDYYAARGDAYYRRGDFRDAASDYDREARFSDPDGYGVIWGSVARMQGRSADAGIALSAALDKGQLRDWPRTVGELLVGRITPAAALASARNSDQTCEAHYYAGIVQLKSKDTVAARNEFAAARDGCPTSFREYRAAIADLKRLQSQ